jgi:MFS family permease
MASVSGLILGSVVLTSATVPDIGKALHSSQSQLQWVGDIYPVVLSAFLLPSGALADRYGRRRGLVLGLILLSVSMVWSGWSQDVGQLIASRALAGIGGAFALPPTLATLTTMMASDKRSQAIAIWVLGGMVGTFVCFFFAGVLTDYFWWGACFVATALLGVACIALVILFVPETRDPAHARMDPVGVALSAIGIGGLVVAVTEGPIAGWDSGMTLGGFALALVAIVAFVPWELHSPKPLLDVRLLRDPMFGTATATLFVLFIADYGMFSLCFQYLAYYFGYSPLQSVVRFLPATIGLVVFAPLAPMAVRRFGRRLVICTGIDICAIGMFLAATWGSNGHYWTLTVCLTIFWSGVATALIPATETIIEALPPAKQGVASAVNDIARELGAAIGIAVLGSAFNAGYRNEVTHLLRGVSGSVVASVRSSPANGLVTAAQSRGDGARTRSVVHSSVVSGWRVALLTAAAIVAVDAIFVYIRFPRSGQETQAALLLDEKLEPA